MVTVNYDFAVFVLLQFGYSLGYFTHGNQDRAFNFDKVILILFSTVDKDEVLAGIEFCFDCLTIDFHYRCLLMVWKTSDTRFSVIRLKSILSAQMLVAINGSESVLSGRQFAAAAVSTGPSEQRQTAATALRHSSFSTSRQAASRNS